MVYRAVEDEKPDMALKMYLDACSILEEDGREQMAFDTYRATVNLYIKLERSAFSSASTIPRLANFTLKTIDMYLHNSVIMHLCNIQGVWIWLKIHSQISMSCREELFIDGVNTCVYS